MRLHNLQCANCRTDKIGLLVIWSKIDYHSVTVVRKSLWRRDDASFAGIFLKITKKTSWFLLCSNELLLEINISQIFGMACSTRRSNTRLNPCAFIPFRDQLFAAVLSCYWHLSSLRIVSGIFIFVWTKLPDQNIQLLSLSACFPLIGVHCKNGASKFTCKYRWKFPQVSLTCGFRK